jgi:hypothetical protein
MLSFWPCALRSNSVFEHQEEAFVFCFSYGIGGKGALLGFCFQRCIVWFLETKRRIGKVCVFAWVSVLCGFFFLFSVLCSVNDLFETIVVFFSIFTNSSLISRTTPSNNL